jgi:hypothetical protein
MREMGRENGVNAYGYSGREGLGIKDMVGGVLGRFGVKCLEEGLCKIELTHRACGLLGGGCRCDYLGQWVKVCQLGGSDSGYNCVSRRKGDLSAG